MDIVSISKEIYKEEPRNPKTICLEIDTLSKNASISFEVISLFFLEGIQLKILPKMIHINSTDNKKMEEFIINSIILLKQYCHSIGITFKYEFLKKSDVKNMIFSKIPNFYNIREYFFEFAFIYNKTLKNKYYKFQYNPSSKLSHIKEGEIILKFGDKLIDIRFDFL